MDWLAESDSPFRILAIPKTWFQKPERRSQAERLRLALEELGTTYIKLGQAISTRTDLLPREYIVELAKLQDQAPKIPCEEIFAVIEAELGQPPDKLFAFFDEEPVAAASIAQVHNAILIDGVKVVVKVQRPGVEQKVEDDLEVLREIAEFMKSNTELGYKYDVAGWLDEFAFTLRTELDYRREAKNAETFRSNFVGDDRVYVPRIYLDYTARRVITMERIEGIKITDFVGMDAAHIDRPRLAHACADIFFTEVFKHGFFHADPHPGNLFVLGNDRIAMIDTGMVGRVDEATSEALMRITLAMARRDVESLIDELLTLGVTTGPVRRQQLKLDLQRLLEMYMEGPDDEISLAQMFNDTLKAAARNSVQVPTDLLFLAKTIAMCEGISRRLDPSFELMSFARTFLKERYMEVRSPQAIASRLQDEYSDIAETVVDLPRRVRRLLSQLERGDLMVSARLENADHLLKSIHQSANRLSMSVLIAGMIAGLSVLTLALRPGDRSGMSDIFLRLFLFLILIVGAAFLASMWRSKHSPLR